MQGGGKEGSAQITIIYPPPAATSGTPTEARRCQELPRPGLSGQSDGRQETVLLL